MTKLLTLDEMLDVLRETKPENVQRWADQLEFIGNQMAAEVTAITGLKSGAAHCEPSAFAGTCVAFYLAHEGQIAPEIFESLDDGETLELYDAPDAESGQ